MMDISFEKLFSLESLYRAHLKARSAKRDKRPLVRFEMCPLYHLYEIYTRLKEGTFKFEKYHSFIVFEPKMREIQTLRYSDRIIQHVLCDDMLMPYFSKRAITDNCVCQIGKGSHFAMRRFEDMLRSFIRKHGVNGYILKCDVLKYFPSIPHKRLKEIFSSRIRDERVRAVVNDCIDSYHTSADYLNRYGIPPLGEGLRGTERGLPIGNQTSQVFGMYYLNAVDRLVKEKLRIKVYSRYMDDMVLVHEDLDTVKNALEEMRKVIKELGLSLNSKTQIFPIKNGVTYLGFRYFVTPTGKLIKNVKKQTKKRMRWRARLLKKAYKENIIGAEKVQMSLASFRGHLMYGNCYKIQAELFKKLSFIAEEGIIMKTARRKRYGK